MAQTCPQCSRSIDLPGPPVAFCCFCGAPLTASALDATTPHAAPAAVPDRLGGYRLVRKLGEGGMGVVFEGEEEATGRRVAVKVIDVSGGDGPGADALERFRQEGRLASAIHHPRCVFVLAADEEAGRPYIVLELMPGRTLDDVVREGGPLPLADALRHTADLIEGLEQVHRLGVIHRDVKPGNCFLDAAGRLKVGDFGLARALARGAKLTRTGSFVGTPLFAAPEQILGQPLDPRADVYAVCATLYFLLAGRAPHDRGDGDGVAVLARAVSEDAPSVRAARPDVPPAVAGVIARGLARDRAARWADLDELRRALAGLDPGAPWSRLGLRAAANLFDYVLLTPPLLVVMPALLGWPTANQNLADPGPILAALAAAYAVALAYFALFDGLAGWTPGQRLLGLRVVRGDDLSRPGLGRGLLRAGVLLAAMAAPSPLLALPFSDDTFLRLGMAGLAVTGACGLTLAAVIGTMRPGNGFRGLHEFASGTQVVSAPEPLARLTFPPAEAPPAPLTDDLPPRLGAFRQGGVVHAGPDGLVVQALDPSLDRLAWVWLRPADAPEVPAVRCGLLRTARLRWLAAGRHAGQRWDAFLAPRGGPLPRVLAGRAALEWAQARTLLAQLVAELLLAKEDDTLPPGLALEQVWLSPDGAVQVVDLPVAGAAEPLPRLALVGAAAAVLLGATPQGPSPQPLPPTPLPGSARRVLRDLPHFGGAARRLEAVAEGLRADARKPARLTLARRAADLMLLLGLFYVFSCCLAQPLIGSAYPILFEQRVTERAEPVEAKVVAVMAADAARLAAPSLTPTTRLVPGSPAFRFAAVQAALGHELRRAEARVAARKRTQWPPMLAMTLATEAGVRAEDGDQGGLPHPTAGLASFVLDEFDVVRSVSAVLTWFQLALLAVLPALAASSALVFRGGLRHRLLGIEVLRTDGRPAGRLRCAARALAAWLPPVVLFGLARYLEDTFWLGWTPGADLTLTTVVVPGLQILALAHIGLTFAVALARPTRAPHDLVTGTCLVPA